MKFDGELPPLSTRMKNGEPENKRVRAPSARHSRFRLPSLARPIPDALLPSLSPPAQELDTLKAKLPTVKKLGEELKGANQVKQLTFFRVSESDDGESADLETDILEAILSDCDTTEDAIMHAVKWYRAALH